jgi:Cu(I)/Ag(I) efflux system periplasmic protein CusF
LNQRGPAASPGNGVIKMMTKVVSLLGAALFATTVFAQVDLPKVEAEVRRVDTSANKISLKHGEVPNLDMPPMTMVFQVSDPTLLENVKAGDMVFVTIDQINGAYTVLSLEPAQ